MLENQTAVSEDHIYPKESLDIESYPNPPITTNSLKEKRLKVKQAYFLGYKAGLSNNIGAGKNFNLDLTEKLSLAWLDGWLDGVEAAEEQYVEMLGGLETAEQSLQLW